MPATLASLRIKNFALVEDLTWNPGPGFNAVSGETGAGKSILIGALKLLLGERADRGLIRTGCDQCAVEALFETPEPERIDPILLSAGAEPCEDGHLIIKRVLTPSGGRQFVNGSLCTLGLLKELGDLLVDLHGPHDHQSLFSREQQTRLLDDYAGLADEAEAYRQARRQWLALLKEQEEIRANALATAREIELLRHQVAEIDGANLLEGEDQELESRHQTAVNARKIRETGAVACALLGDAEPSLIGLCGELGRQTRDLARLDPGAEPFAVRQVELNEILLELGRDMQRHLESIDEDPARLAELESRMDVLGSLRRKYGQTVDEIFAFREASASRLAELEGREERGTHLADAISSEEKNVTRLGAKLSQARAVAARKLARTVAAELRDLNFKQASFSLELEPLDEPGPHGCELAEFVFAPNPGEPPRALRQIASSGEISRVMLALKCALAAQDRVALLVFDEIDANVGGETASKVAAKMAGLGRNRQVLCITHLPQVAAAAGTQFLVAKEVKDARTISRLTRLDGHAREEEIARMLGGRGGSALEHAKTLLGSSA
jgi:DNA repair protein RecN (Recombination protein N)